MKILYGNPRPKMGKMFGEPSSNLLMRINSRLEFKRSGPHHGFQAYNLTILKLLLLLMDFTCSNLLSDVPSKHLLYTGKCWPFNQKVLTDLEEQGKCVRVLAQLEVTPRSLQGFLKTWRNEGKQSTTRCVIYIYGTFLRLFRADLLSQWRSNKVTFHRLKLNRFTPRIHWEYKGYKGGALSVPCVWTY